MAQGKNGGKFGDAQRLAAFWEKVLIRGSNDCWLWLGAKSNNGYGRFWTGIKCVNAQVFAYETTGKKIPKGMYGCHSCDNPSCVNPTHIFPGSPSTNQKDCVLKGRKNISLKMITANAKFTPEQVVSIRADARNHSVLAREYGVDRATIRNIRIRKSWGHIP